MLSLIVSGSIKMIKRIHVNSNKIKSNAKHGTSEPTITVRYNNKIMGYFHEVDILGDSRIIYSPDKPLPCGAKVWIETEAELLTNDGTRL